jgi:DNA-binding transcriptional LysR family regulator
MDRIDALAAFHAAAADGGFAAAARRLKLSRAQVSKLIAEMETQLGARLFQRTTRRLNLTEAGRSYLNATRGVLETLDSAANAVRDTQSTLTGPLRINAPVSFGTAHIAPLLTGFLAQHPGVQIDLTLNDRVVDLIEEGYDMVVRIGVLPDSSLIARRLAPARLAIVGAPAYFKRQGRPKRPEDLKAHNCLGYSYWSLRDEWPLTGPDGRTTRVKVRGTFSSNNGDALRQCALDGLGLIQQPTFSIGPDLAAGRLERVLTGYGLRDLAVYAVTAPGAAGLKQRAFADYLARAWAGTPPWDKGWK